MAQSLETRFPIAEALAPPFFLAAQRAAFSLAWPITYAAAYHLEISSAFDEDGEVVGLSVTYLEQEREIAISAAQILGDYNPTKQEEILKQFLEETKRIVHAPEVAAASPEIRMEPSIPSFNWWEVFVPGKVLLFTPLLFWLNVLPFVTMVIAGAHILEPSSETLIAWGANYTPLTLGGQGWRLLSSVFLHIGVEHLLANMTALIFIGIVVEPVVGKGRFLLSYLVAGIMGSIFSLWWHTVTLSAGASGAIFGMYGLYLALLTTQLIDKQWRKRSLLLFALYIVYSLAGGLQGHIDNAAHIGGLLAGIFMGYLYYPYLKSANNKKQKQKEEMPI